MHRRPSHPESIPWKGENVAEPWALIPRPVPSNAETTKTSLSLSLRSPSPLQQFPPLRPARRHRHTLVLKPRLPAVACVPRTFHSLSISRFHPLSCTLFLADRVSTFASFLVNPSSPPSRWPRDPNLVAAARSNKARPSWRACTYTCHGRARSSMYTDTRARRGRYAQTSGVVNWARAGFVFLIARRTRARAREMLVHLY